MQESVFVYFTQHLSCSDEDSSLEQHSQADGENGFGLTFEQEQTADQLLADIQNAVDEMLQDFTSLMPQHSPSTTPVSSEFQVFAQISSKHCPSKLSIQHLTAFLLL